MQVSPLEKQTERGERKSSLSESHLSPYSINAQAAQQQKSPRLESGLPPHRVLSHPDCVRISPPPPPRCVLREVCNDHVSSFFLLERSSRDPLRPEGEMEAIIG